ncbi:hypothetical protein QJU93_07310 [Pasteurella skyensis]|uniref:Uncharacterized protein n=1 Tax=Phocoenobacter skyensis TaxID=97481 RepID=A0AAJ6P0Z8_9PAST|nr:hypothetical protein [Pasteurella skyensis]MDP8173164.1 hypothetical protein [Pasteurella skyensis]MDP8176386.1 hypothetical protein [Pasteurella skyensis]MDP8178903.1 hypothetical protein [Pasteurella skyensis]MDP8199101.1 hypothetical protein [Pasteurella skyensis]
MTNKTVQQTLAERGKIYGCFDATASTSQQLKQCVNEAIANNKQHTFTKSQKESIEMLCVKIARICNGDPNYLDNWIDINGYSTLGGRLKTEQEEKDNHLYYWYKPRRCGVETLEKWVNELFSENSSENGLKVWGSKICIEDPKLKVPKAKCNGCLDLANLYFDAINLFQQQLSHCINKNIDKKEETTMEEKTFKAGDRVYYPEYTNKICTLEECKTEETPLKILLNSSSSYSGYNLLTEKGCNGISNTQKIFFATEENYKLLSQLYSNIEFEKPKLKGSELAKKLAKDQYILAWVSDDSEKEARRDRICDVVKYDSSCIQFITEELVEWEFAIPVNLTKEGTVEITERDLENESAGMC